MHHQLNRTANGQGSTGGDKPGGYVPTEMSTNRDALLMSGPNLEGQIPVAQPRNINIPIQNVPNPDYDTPLSSRVNEQAQIGNLDEGLYEYPFLGGQLHQQIPMAAVIQMSTGSMASDQQPQVGAETGLYIGMNTSGQGSTLEQEIPQLELKPLIPTHRQSPLMTRTQSGNQSPHHPHSSHQSPVPSHHSPSSGSIQGRSTVIPNNDHHNTDNVASSQQLSRAGTPQVDPLIQYKTAPQTPICHTSNISIATTHGNIQLPTNTEGNGIEYQSHPNPYHQHQPGTESPTSRSATHSGNSQSPIQMGPRASTPKRAPLPYKGPTRSPPSEPPPDPPRQTMHQNIPSKKVPHTMPRQTIPGLQNPFANITHPVKNGQMAWDNSYMEMGFGNQPLYVDANTGQPILNQGSYQVPMLTPLQQTILDRQILQHRLAMQEHVSQVFQQTYGHPLQNGPAGGQGNQPGPNPQQNQQAAGGVAAGRGGGGFGGDDSESSDGDDNNDRRRGGNPGRGHGRRSGPGGGPNGPGRGPNGPGRGPNGPGRGPNGPGRGPNGPGRGYGGPGRGGPPPPPPPNNNNNNNNNNNDAMAMIMRMFVQAMTNQTTAFQAIGQNIVTGNRNNQNAVARAFGQISADKPIKWTNTPYFRPHEPPTPKADGSEVMNNVERWAELIRPTLASAPINESAKVKSIMILLLGAAADYCRKYRHDGSPGHTSDIIMNDLVVTFRSQETANQMRTRMLRARRRPGQPIMIFRLYLMQMATDICRRDATLRETCDRDIWRMILEECPDSLRVRLEDRYTYEQIDEAIQDIDEFSARQPEKSPFSNKRLLIEKKSGKVNKSGHVNINTYSSSRQTNLLAIEAPPVTEETGVTSLGHDRSIEVSPGPTITEVSDETADELLSTNACFNCGKPGHIRRDCPSSDQLKQAIPPKQDSMRKDNNQKKGNYTKNKNNQNKSKPGGSKPKYYCELCKRAGHTLSYCRIYKEAKRLINRESKEIRTYYAEKATENPYDVSLQPLGSEIISLIEENTEEDPDVVLTTLFTKESLWDGEGYDSDYTSSE